MGNNKDYSTEMVPGLDGKNITIKGFNNNISSNINVDRSYLIGIHRFSYRAGEPAEILGVCSYHTKKGFVNCYHIKYDDKQEDYVNIEDKENYKIITREDYLNGNIPEVTQ